MDPTEPVCIPKMLYAAELWARPACRERTANQVTRRPLDRIPAGRMAKMQSVLRRALVAAVGAMRGTPTDIIEAHLNVLPIDLHLENVRHRALMRLISLPQTHPLHQLVRDARDHPRNNHESALHALTRRYRTRPDLMEEIMVVRQPPYWRPTFEVTKPGRMKKGREEAAADDEARTAAGETRVYSDGSAHDGGVGSAAHLVRPDGTTASLRLHLGSMAHYTVHAAEGVGLMLALHLLYREPVLTEQVSIGIDNQALITGMLRYKHGAGQQAVDRARELIEYLVAERNIALTIRWTPGHCGIEGNERADDEAKTAAEGPHGSTDAALLPDFTQNPIPRSVAAIQQAFEARTRQRAIKRWRRSKRYNTSKAIDDSMPSNKFLKLVHSMPRNQSTLLIWLRTGYAPLNYHLHRIHAIDSPECENCRTETAETTKHFLLDCPAHERARRTLQKALGHRKAGAIPFLLSNPDAMAPLMKFIDDTGRFTDRLGTLTAAATTQPQGAEDAAAAA
jgi:ribonuclease HI